MKQGMANVLARMYAKAFVRVFGDKLNYVVCASLLDVADSHGHALRFYFKLQALSAQKKREALYMFINTYKLPKELNQLVDILVLKKRSELFFACARAIVAYYRKIHAIESFYVTSSPGLSIEEQELVKKFIKTEIPGDHVFAFHEDKSLIAGIRVQSKQVLWEYSIAQQLRRVRNALPV